MNKEKDLEKIQEEVINSLKEISDPELGINIVDLGLIKKIEIGEYLEDFKIYEYIKVIMTLTSVMCPFADKIIEDVELKVNSLNLGEAQVELDFSEPWEPSEELRIQLGI
jgi:metal-sulfur cluster biosynthetic enzyme